MLGATVVPGGPAGAQVPAPSGPPRAGAASDTVAGGAAPGAVAGVVFDSIAGAPLAGAQVQLVDTAERRRSYTAASDSAGRFRIGGVLPGGYLAGFFHPALDALGLESPLRLVAVSPGATTEVQLAIPGASRVAAVICGSRPAGDSTGAMAGVVRDADSGIPIPGARVVVTWTELIVDQRGLRQERRRVPVPVRPDGTYTVCGLPGDELVASAESGARRTGLVQVAVPARGILRRDFALGDVQPGQPGAMGAAGDSSLVLRGAARLTGVVRASDGAPVAGARVFVWGTGRSAVTGRDGRFALDSLPSGTFSAEARAIGYSPTLAAVDLSRQGPATVSLRFGARVTQLGRVTIYGRRSLASRGLDEFLQRSRTGMGRYITGAEMERRGVLTVTEALRMIPGLRVTPSSGFGYAVTARGGCAPEVYVDGMRTFDGSQSLDRLVQPNQVAGIEVYTGLGAVPARYQSNGCGVLLVWTLR